VLTNRSSSLGGTNLRVCLVSLQGGGKFEITQSKYRLAEEQKQEDGQLLFDFCAECLKTFINSSIESGAIEVGNVLPLGFTVSHSILCEWVPSFKTCNPLLVLVLVSLLVSAQ
jgi:hexokinase